MSTLPCNARNRVIFPMSDGMTTSRSRRLSIELRELLANVSGRTIEELEESKTFIDLGFDSLLLTQVAQTVSRMFGAPVRLRQLLEDLSSLPALAKYLDEHLPEESRPAAGHEEVVGLINQGTCGPEAPLAAMVMTQQLAVMARQIAALTQGATNARAAQLVRRASTDDTPGAPEAAFLAPPVVGEDLPPVTIRDHGVGSEIQIGRAKSGPLTAEQRRHAEALIARYAERTKQSKAFAQKNRAQLADPSVAQGFELATKEAVYPIVASRSSGSRLWDLDGNEYVDLMNGGGSVLFGHAPTFLTEALQTQLGRGMLEGAQSPLVEGVVAAFRKLTGAERLTLCSGPLEAMLGALRVARTVTGRDTIVLLEGAHHGALDEVLVRANRSGGAVAAAAGILPAGVEHVLVLDPKDPTWLERVRSRVGEIAAVLIDPRSCGDGEAARALLGEIRELTRAGGTALIFDETVTGFRCAPGGAQELFGVRADLAVYGSAASGGVPFGALAGRAAYMDAVDGGPWRFGDASLPEAGVTDFVGPGARHPLALAAARTVLDRLLELGPELQGSLASAARRFTTALGGWLTRRRATISVREFGSMVTLDMDREEPFRDYFFIHLREKGVHVVANRPLFFTAAHSEADVDFVVAQFQRTVTDLEDGGFLVRRTGGHEGEGPPVPGARLGRDANGNPAWFVPDPTRPGMFQQVEVST
jgi:glutamate-1-semialdehyde aminotransferase/acyl carrier protein